MKGSPPTRSSDFGTVAVSAPSRVASPPARIAVTSPESSRDSYPSGSLIASFTRHGGKLQDDLCSVGQVTCLKIRLGFVSGADRRMVCLDPNRPHCRRVTALNIGRPVPDYP